MAIDLGSTVKDLIDEVNSKAPKSDIPSTSDCAKLSGNNTFTGNNTFNKDVVIKAPHRDTYYASNLCRHFSRNTPTEFVIKTKIKFVSITHMPVVRIYGYAYGKKSPIELRIAFYIFNGAFDNTGVSCTGAWKPNVYLFKYTEDDIDWVAIGLKDSCYFCGFQVDAQIGALGAFNTAFQIDGWTTTHNGADTSVSLIPAVGTDKCIQVEYKSMQTDIGGNASTATKLANARTISLSGDVSGSASFDGSANATITATVADDSHNHVISNVDGLQTALDNKLNKTATAVSASCIAYSLKKSSEASTAIGYYKFATITFLTWRQCSVTILATNSYVGNQFNTLFTLRCYSNTIGIKGFSFKIIGGEDISNKLSYITTKDSDDNITKIELYIQCNRFEHTTLHIIGKYIDDNFLTFNESFGGDNPDKDSDTVMTGNAVYTISTANHTHSVTAAGTNSSTSITPAGTVSQPTFTGTAASHNHTFTGTAASHNHTFSGTAASHSHTFTGTEATIKSTYTPSGSVTSGFTGTAHNHTFTGSAVTSGKPDTTNVTTIYSITGVGSLPSASLSSGTLPSCSYTAPSLTASVENQCLTLSFNAGSHSFNAGAFPTLTFSAGSLPTRSSAISMPNANHTHSVTASGTIGNATAGGTVSSSFSGTEGEATATYTPAGTISSTSVTPAGTISDKSITPAGTISNTSITPAGTVSQPTFTGTAASHTHTFTGSAVNSATES